MHWRAARRPDPGRGFATVASGVAIALLAIGGARMGDAHEVPAGPAREEPTTKFEAFVVARCSPCVRESYSLTTLPIAPLRPPGFGPAVASLMARGGEVRLEVVRAYPLGNVAEQVFVMRATLSIKAGEGQLYPVSTGLLDEDEVTALERCRGHIQAHLDSAVTGISARHDGNG